MTASKERKATHGAEEDATPGAPVVDGFDHKQVVLDLEEARHRLLLLHKAIEERDARRAELADAQRVVRQAKRRLQEAELTMKDLLLREKRR